MKNLHHRPEWRAFRALIVEHDGGVCQICKRGPSDGVILQVHHKVYHKGRLPWDYDPSDCQTLCKLHHAEFHEKIRPSTGWDLVLEDDLGGLDGVCEACGTGIRYVFHIDHPRWHPLAVGTYCCDRLTGTTDASESRLKAERKERFLNSDNWKDTNGIHSIERMKMNFLIRKDSRGHFIHFMGVDGRTRFPSLDQAKDGLFHLIDSGDARRFKNKTRKEAKG